MKKSITGFLVVSALMITNTASFAEASVMLKGAASNYPVVDTGQYKFYGDDRAMSRPASGDRFFGQDANYSANPPSYTDNIDGTITDNVTGLMWQKDMGSKLAFSEAIDKAKALKLGGHDDWRVPTIKELYSLILFSGKVKGQKAITPFIDTRYFNQPLGGAVSGEREIDAQTWSRTEYTGKTMRGDASIFGVNFVDGRIKAYPKSNPRTRQPNKMYFRLVRGGQAYGENTFVARGRGSVFDSATGLVWQQSDSAKGMNWEDALSFCEGLTLDGQTGWRLPNAKELQSIVDYSRSPEQTNSAAIDPIFKSSRISNEGKQKDYPYYWSSTTHLDGPIPEKGAAYLAFGRALGQIHGRVVDAHGAGAQRSDPKTGGSMSRGPQGDFIRVQNYVRCVRGGGAKQTTQVVNERAGQYPSKANTMKRSVPAERPSSPSGGNHFMNRFDSNGDGRVSEHEFTGRSNRFTHFDANNDGYISKDEAAVIRRPKR